MLVGDAAAWANRFINFDERFLERIVEVWPACVAALPGQPEEDAITINLVHHLGKDSVVRRLCHWVEYQYEPFGLAPDGSHHSKGRIDMAVLFDRERERYLAYECKRLNVVNGGGRSSLATAYVTQGMMRFITEQYSEDLPIGCMLGYVMDGHLAFAQSRVHAAIAAHAPLMVQAGPDDLEPILAVPRTRSLHIRTGGAPIEVRHAFLSFA
ncbi:hypothetical protein RQ734_20650 [Roseomonas mucosa]|uniref:hypothetical protein n=1 Tax=Roseomonas mucosa TaxID=207340 RepID=UPI0028CE5622|nr:hypothetical protein [Roseomonas mucosa]MDT8278472.1 hypothetical protein [Roseomonas mucosa]